jgi:hypothetical protein
VDAAIAEREAKLSACAAEARRRGEAIGELEGIADHLAELVVERDRELRRLRDELADASRRGEEALAAVAALAGEVGEIRRQARAQATRMRLAALRQAAEVAQRAKDLPAGSGEWDGLVAALTAAVDRLGIDEDPEAAASVNGHRAGPKGPLFEGLVEVEIGPFADFSQLVGFEDAARSIAATTELSIRRFSAGRATLAMNLKEPVELLRELEERCDLEFKIRDQRPGRVVLDVDADAG